MKYKLVQYIPENQVLVLSDENEFIIFDTRLEFQDIILDINGVRYGFSHKLKDYEIFELLTIPIKVTKV